MNKNHKTIKKWWDSLDTDDRIERLNAAIRAGYANPCMFEAWEVTQQEIEEVKKEGEEGRRRNANRIYM